MPEKNGMIFVFPRNTVATFWMKDTLLPLDMIFVDLGGRIIKIHKNAVPLDVKTYISSEVPVRAVIEVNGGMADKWGLVPGDMVASPALGREVARGPAK